MIENVYELADELSCDELYLLRDREHMKSSTIKYIMSKKCDVVYK